MFILYFKKMGEERDMWEDSNTSIIIFLKEYGIYLLKVILWDHMFICLLFLCPQNFLKDNAVALRK